MILLQIMIWVIAYIFVGCLVIKVLKIDDDKMGNILMWPVWVILATVAAIMLIVEKIKEGKF